MEKEFNTPRDEVSFYKEAYEQEKARSEFLEMLFRLAKVME